MTMMNCQEFTFGKLTILQEDRFPNKLPQWNSSPLYIYAVDQIYDVYRRDIIGSRDC